MSTFWSSQEIMFLFKQIFKTTISTPNLFFLFPKEFNLSYPTESSLFFFLSLSFSSNSHACKYQCPLIYRNYPYNLAMLWSLILKITSDLGISSELDHFKYHRYLNKGYLWVVFHYLSFFSIFDWLEWTTHLMFILWSCRFFNGHLLSIPIL